MRSPILQLQKSIAGVPFTSAPEKEAQCVEHRDTYNITCVLVDETNFGIRVRLREDNTPEIVLPIAALEYLWAFSHYCWVLTQEYSKSQKEGNTQFNCVGNNRLSESYSVLEWAKNNLTSTGIDSWPNAGPRPRATPISRGDDEHVATELFLVALSWMLHHERGHIVLGHPFVDTSFSEQEEREADKFATEWLFGGVEETDPRLKKRGLGLAIAVLCLQSLEVDTVACLKSTHPAAHDRIFANTSYYQCGTEELLEATCTVVLQYLFHNKGVNANIDGSTFSEILGDLLYDISRNTSS
jgi:hypothetical protein